MRNQNLFRDSKKGAYDIVMCYSLLETKSPFCLVLLAFLDEANAFISRDDDSLAIRKPLDSKFKSPFSFYTCVANFDFWQELDRRLILIDFIHIQISICTSRCHILPRWIHLSTLGLAPFMSRPARKWHLIFRVVNGHMFIVRDSKYPLVSIIPHFLNIRVKLHCEDCIALIKNSRVFFE